MKALLSQSIKAGLLALGLTAGLAAPTFAAPLPQLLPSAPVGAAPEIIPVRSDWAGNGGNNSNYWRYNRHHRNWRGDGWRGNNWRRHYRDDWRWRHHHRRNYSGSGIYFGLGGFGVVPGYDYYAPRRTYRVYRGGSAHVRWCYDRYRSYRASDNTYQPYNGPRRQCRSPYRW